MKFDTRAIHAGQDPDPATGAVVAPIYQTSTYLQPEPGKHSGYQYSRTANPTRTALETCLASLEEAGFGFAFSSGMAAGDAVLRLLKPGDHVLVGTDLYGGTRRLLQTLLAQWGVEHSSVDMTSALAVVEGIRPGTKMVWIESPTNPHLRVADIPAICEAARARGALSVVDNTFATPCLQRPLILGADLVLHSTTKYLGGHSDVLSGAVCTSDPGLAEKIRKIQVTAGAVCGPFDAWLVLRGIKTLGIRMRRHCENAQRIADFLAGHPAVKKVWYPGRKDHPEHDLAARQMDGFGGIVSVETGSRDEAVKFVSQTELFSLAESLGGVESLIGYPAMMSHAFATGGEFAAPENLVRLSVGIEDPEDLREDLRRALAG